MHSEVYIVIVTYNAMPWLKKCLKSTQPFKVIVVDNCSQDGTVEYIKNNFPQVKVLQQKTNHGFGKANNIGISWALSKGAEFVFLLNQDAYLLSDCIQIMLKVTKDLPEYGILCPVHLDGTGERLDARFSNCVNYSSNPDIFSDLILQKEVQPVYEVPFVNAAGWLIHKNCLTKIGGFDPIFFHYGEDDNYCQRLMYHGFKLGVVSKALMIHDRESREPVEYELYSPDYLKRKERSYKIVYADVNNNIDMSPAKKKLVKSVIKSFFLCRFSRVQYYWKELRMLQNIEPEIKSSRKRNREIGSHYL